MKPTGWKSSRHADWGPTWTYRDSALEIGFAPSVGRIVNFSKPGGPNRLWVSPEANSAPAGCWANYGGEKLWLWPQSGWTSCGQAWPPPSDPIAYEVTANNNILHLRSESVPGYGLRFVRRLSVVPGQGLLRIENSLEGLRETGAPEARLWTVIQVPRPSQVLAWPTHPGPVTLRDLDGSGGGFRLERPDARPASILLPTSSGKVGLDAWKLSSSSPTGGISVSVPHESGDAGDFDPCERAQIFADHEGPSPNRPPLSQPYIELEFVAPKASHDAHPSNLTVDWALEDENPQF